MEFGGYAKGLVNVRTLIRRRLGMTPPKDETMTAQKFSNAQNMCRKMKAKHEVIPNTSWGTLPVELQRLWKSLECKKFMAEDAEAATAAGGTGPEHTAAATADSNGGTLGIMGTLRLAIDHALDHHTHGTTHGEHVTDDYVKVEGGDASTATGTSGSGIGSISNSIGDLFSDLKAQRREQKKEKREAKLAAKLQGAKSGVTAGAGALTGDTSQLVVSDAAADRELGIALPKLKKDDEDWCKENKEKYHVQPQKSWGRLPQDAIAQWRKRHCDLTFTLGRMQKTPLSRCADVAKNFESADSLPLVSVLAASTSRKVPGASVKNLSLFTYLLPSLIRTLDCGYRYEYTLGFDVGDPFYDSDLGMASVDAWFAENVVKPLGKRGIRMLPIRKVKVNNTLRKPGPVFLEMGRATYDGGADYMYRVNDDTELLDKWTNAFVRALVAVNGVGAVGPTCTQGNTAILTHDFVSRVHMEIMDMNYYPPQLVDWWMDDWISFVYGQQRTFKARNVRVVHHTNAHGRRYKVDQKNKGHLKRLISDGKNAILKFLLRTNAPSSAVKAMEKEIANKKSFTFTHKDVSLS